VLHTSVFIVCSAYTTLKLYLSKKPLFAALLQTFIYSAHMLQMLLKQTLQLQPAVAEAVLQIHSLSEDCKSHSSITECKEVLCLLNNKYLGIFLWPYIQYKVRVFKYITAVKADFSHLYFLDKDISVLLSISFTEWVKILLNWWPLVIAAYSMG